MNEGVFNSYDNSYHGSTFQMADLNSSVSFMEPEFNYFNEATAPSTHTNYLPVQEQQFAQTFQTMFHAAAAAATPQHQQQPTANAQNAILSAMRTLHAEDKSVSSSENGATASQFNSIPFVQIHTTDVQPQRNSYGNVFRRQSAQEIKSEPIKSEQTEAAAKESHANSTPTPPAPTLGSQATTSAGAGIPNTTARVASTITRPDHPVVFKCMQCPLLSLSKQQLAEHAAAMHGNVAQSSAQRRIISCPGELSYYPIQHIHHVQLVLGGNKI